MKTTIDRSKYNNFEAFYQNFKKEFAKLQEFRDHWNDKIKEIGTPKYTDDDFVTVGGLNFYKEYMSGGDCYVNPDNDISYYNFDQAQKRAKELGLKVPTNKQFQQLYDNTYQVFTKEGVVFVDKATGRYILFNYYGRRNDSNGAFYWVGTNGCLWSSVQYSSSVGYYLFFYSGNVIPQANSYRAFGFPVRCVIN